MKILIIGGRGMVGKAICSKLSKHNIHTFDRHEGPKNHIQGNILKPFDVYSACKGMDYVINLVGLSPLRKPKGISYQQAHVNGVINILEGCHKHKCNLIHISALGAKKTGPTEYLRSKGRGEELIKLSGVKHTILRPSLIYSKDHELNKIVDKYSWTRMFLNIPAKIQPISSSDVGDLISLIIKGKVKETSIDTVGSKTYSIGEFVKKLYSKKKRMCLLIPLWLALPGMFTFANFGLFGFGFDQIRTMSLSFVSKNDLNKYFKLNDI